MRTAVLIIAAVVIVLGLLFTLQGLGFVGGSGMTDDRKWAVIGLAMVVVGLVVGGIALRRMTP